ncbi:MAG: hypothetical protein GY835_24115, partial [bacterium]|nr:hypothetical protein [bacterium]
MNQKPNCLYLIGASLMLSASLLGVMLNPAVTHASRANDVSAVVVYPDHPRLIVGGYRGVSVAQMQTRCADPAFQAECAAIGDYGH